MLIAPPIDIAPRVVENFGDCDLVGFDALPLSVFASTNVRLGNTSWSWKIFACATQQSVGHVGPHTTGSTLDLFVQGVPVFRLATPLGFGKGAMQSVLDCSDGLQLCGIFLCCPCTDPNEL